jgi:hypothetical protein
VSLFTPEQFESLHNRAAIREMFAAVECKTTVTETTADNWRRFKRYRRLIRHNSHRFSYRVAFGVDDTTTDRNLQKYLDAGTLVIIGDKFDK